ncbi:hypothetical protein [Streptomyces iranensis]|uniref:Uncharacterized protein n=1 Tax=Streptomyces iranensis TaxID=576784 RepID=A0A060ZU28_9ACTN|nr:hypothetical protein [Streptomyces iranensis]MBP2064048.1 hypothetical protein [Streptomyces iranensis]CDR06547.1 predicted protein [Streptomyces iranensis]
MELRRHDEIIAMINHVSQHGYSSAGYARGLLAALHWVAGLTAAPPVSDVPLGRPVSASDAYQEQDRAYEAMSVLAEPSLLAVAEEQGLDYVTAVENTLAWAVGEHGLTAPWD